MVAKYLKSDDGGTTMKIKVYKYGLPVQQSMQRGCEVPKNISLLMAQFREGNKLYNSIIEEGRALAFVKKDKNGDDIYLKEGKPLFSYDPKGLVKGIKQAKDRYDGCMWNTENTLVEHARKSILESYKAGRKPRFKRFGERIDIIGGQVSTHRTDLGTGQLVASVTAMSNNWLRIERTNGKQARLWIRVGSENGNPIWAILPMIYHRDLPATGLITTAVVHRERVGTRFVWSVTITVKEEDGPMQHRENQWVAIDFAYRSVGEYVAVGRAGHIERAIRVAYALGSDGRVHELILPPDLVGRKAFAESIKSQRDKCADAVLAKAHGIIGDNEIQDTSRTKEGRVRVWNAARLERGMAADKEKRKANPINLLNGLFHATSKTLAPTLVELELRELLREWKHRDNHLLDYQRGTTRRLSARRLDIFRNWARGLEREYTYAAIEDFRQTEGEENTITRKCRAKTVREGKTESSQERLRRQRSIAAPGELKAVLLGAFGGMRSVLVDAAYTSKTCPECAQKQKNKNSKIMFTCEFCGYTADRDIVACRNIATRARFERFNDATKAAAVRSDIEIANVKGNMRWKELGRGNRLWKWQGDKKYTCKVTTCKPKRKSLETLDN